MDLEDIVWRLIGAIALIVVIGLMALGSHAIYSGYERGQEKREAQNQSVIERERIVQDALRKYRER